MREESKGHITDPAFLACLHAAAANPELVANFDRLTGSNVGLRGSPIELAVDEASGRQEDDVRRFVVFVKDCVYDRLEPDALQDLRRQAAEKVAHEGEGV